MKKQFLLMAIAMMIGLSWPAQAAEWSYEGETGPDNWATLDESYAACGAVNQSPIDITGTTQALLPEIEFDYDDSDLNLLNNGHTVQVNYESGSSISIDGEEFELLQLHFHSTSEHLINGVSYPMEVHLVHQNEAGHLAVIGVMFEIGEENAFVDSIWSQLGDAEVGEVLDVEDVEIDANGLLPNTLEYYRYNGSLTTPPCSEGVRWMVMKDGLEISAEQVEAFTALFGENNRPVLPVNARVILH